MTEASDYIELEGRIIAHRRILEVLLREAAGRAEDADAFWARFENYLTVQDYEEDPGVLPDGAYATMVAATQELKSMLRQARNGGG